MHRRLIGFLVCDKLRSVTASQIIEEIKRLDPKEQVGVIRFAYQVKRKCGGYFSHVVPEQSAKEHLRVTFQSHFMSEISDVDGIFWGEQFTYPLEIKEKTPAPSKKLGPFFGLDVGPFVKLAYYVAKRGNLHSLFVVREIANLETRELVNWSFITFEQLARFASWFPMAGGTSMGGGRSSVVCIPKAEFRELNKANLDEL